MRALFGFLVAFLMLASMPAVAGDVAKTVYIGEKEIDLPLMEGYKEVYGTNARFDGLARQLVPPGNRLLGVYLLPEDAQAIKAGTQTAMQRYIIVQTLKDDITIKSAADFAAFKGQVLTEAGADFSKNPEALQQANQISKYIKENYAEDAEVKVGETKILEAFIDEEKVLGISMIANIGVQVGAETRAIPVGLSLLVLDLKSKPIFATVYTIYSGAKDSDMVKKTGADFAKRMFLVNDEDAPSINAGDKNRAEEEAEAADDRLSYAMVATGVISVLVLCFFILVPLIKRLSGGNKDESI